MNKKMVIGVAVVVVCAGIVLGAVTIVQKFARETAQVSTTGNTITISLVAGEGTILGTEVESNGKPTGAYVVQVKRDNNTCIFTTLHPDSS